MPEKTLIALIASGRMPADAVKPEDFDDPYLRQLAQKLLSGSPPAAILANCESEQERVIASETFALNAEITEENATTIAEDCLRTIRIARLQRQIDQVRLRLDELSGDEKGAALKELMTLSTEMARIKRAVH